MSRHTPGPWYHWDNDGRLGVGKKHSDEADILNAVSQSNRPRSEDIANMRLAAAAPCLFEALDRMLDQFEGCIPLELFEFAESSITRAKGTS